MAQKQPPETAGSKYRHAERPILTLRSARRLAKMNQRRLSGELSIPLNGWNEGANAPFRESGTDRLLERLWNMLHPITIDVPHELGRVAARAKLEKGLGQVAAAVPGGSLRSHHWEGDTLIFEVEAMGQRVGAKLEVFDTRIHAVVNLPPLAALFAEKIKTKLSEAGTKLLR